MPLIIPNELPATEALLNENIFTMSESRATQQDIRPLKIVIVNLMPTKIATETQKALISDLRIKLEQAEKRIADLEYIENGDASTEETPNEVETETAQTTDAKSGCKSDIATTAIATVIALVCAMAFITVRRKKANEL